MQHLDSRLGFLVLLAVLFEDVPFTVMNCVIMFVDGIFDPVLVASTLFSMLLLGTKAASLGKLWASVKRHAAAGSSRTATHV